ncbi:MAG: class I SAM-dependent methyltransferase [Hyphomicrobiales bacterium]
MQNAKKFWDNAAEKYAKSPIADMKAYEYTLERTKSYLTKEDHVLELGCGTGSTALLLAPDVKHITGSDLSSNMVQIAERKAQAKSVSNSRFIVSDINGEDLPKGPYDVVLAFNLIHLLEDTPAVMKRISQLVKPGGLFISKTVCKPGKGTPFKLRIMLLVLPLMQFFGKAPFVQFMEIAELERHVTEAGFKIIETGNHPVAPPSRYIVAKKVGN